MEPNAFLNLIENHQRPIGILHLRPLSCGTKKPRTKEQDFHVLKLN